MDEEPALGIEARTNLEGNLPFPSGLLPLLVALKSCGNTTKKEGKEKKK